MPVIDSGAIFPKPNVTVEQPEGPETVGFDDGFGVKAKDMVDLGEPETVDHSDLHTPRSTNSFEVPDPVSVVLEGYEGVEGKTTSPQVKLVKAPAKGGSKGTRGAESK